VENEQHGTTLSIGELAARTGVAVGTLRTWETRYGVPTPHRVPSGHRRYSLDDVALVLETLRHRDRGLSMPHAVEQARSQLQQVEPSVFAGLRDRHPDLRVQELRKPAVLALCRAIEDECAARADRPVLFGAFQRTRFYGASKDRWRELSRTALSAVVFADFPTAPTDAGPGPKEVAVPVDSPMNREWVLVCDSVDYPGVVVGWERPEEAGRGRGFETLWSVEPRVVRDAARICAALAEDFSPGYRFPHWPELDGTPPAASPETRRASGVLDRMLHYLAGGSLTG
jgi:DNA-binding transcriptional MerR regulator